MDTAKKGRHPSNRQGGKATADFSWEEFLAGFRQADSGNGAVRTVEIAELTGHCEKWVRDRIRKALAMGKIKRARVQREDLSGRLVTVAAYQLVE